MRPLLFFGGLLMVVAAIPFNFDFHKQPKVSPITAQADAAMILSFTSFRSLDKPQPKPTPVPPAPKPDGEAGLSG